MVTNKGVLLLLFQNTIREVVDGIMIFLGNDYKEDDVVEVDGEPFQDCQSRYVENCIFHISRC